MSTVTKEPGTAAPSSSVVTSSEDESLKRNTDCVYFLASPLTCKKGSECEYRHSEYARVNPRDCWYWLNGNCLNPKCSFRHPPLDSLMGPQVGSFAAPSIPTPPVPAAPVLPHNAAAKQAVPCIFFQKGYCLKGDRCPFMHGPTPPGTKVQQVSASTPATEPPFVKPTFGGLEKCAQPKVNIQADASKKVVETPAQVNAIPKVETSQPRDGVSAGRRGPPPSALIEEAPKYKETTVPSIDNGRSRNRTAHVHRANSLDDQNFQNGRDADDTLRESSPGFDVLVDDKLRDEEYYQHEDQFVRMRAHDGRNLNEFEMNRYDDYNSVVDVDSELYHNQRGYDSYDHLPERYAWDQRRASSERSPGEPAQFDRRASYKSESPDFVQNSDLRQRLSKQRRVNGLKSIVNPDYNRDNHAEDRGYRATQRETRRSPTHESSRNSRLQGRIKLPRRSPPVGSGNMHSEREHGSRGRNWGRSSPSRPQAASQQGRLQDRLSGRIHEDVNEGRISRNPGTRRDSIKENLTDFAGPKSLAELKGSKQTDNKQQQQQQQLKGQQSVSGGKLRDRVLASSVGSGGDLSFDGPKPLSEILKRKRDTGISASTGGTKSGNKEDTQNGNNDDPLSSNVDSAADIKKQTRLFSELEQTQVSKVENKPVTAEGDEEGEISNKKMKLTEGEASIPNEKEQPDIEEGLNVVEGEEQEQEHEHEHEGDEEFDQGDGEYEYEQYDGEGYDLNEGETVDNEDDFMDEDDGDDFAKKIGVSI